MFINCDVCILSWRPSPNLDMFFVCYQITSVMVMCIISALVAGIGTIIAAIFWVLSTLTGNDYRGDTAYKYKASQLTNLTNPTMQLFHIPQFTIQNRNVHIFVLNGALWDVKQLHCWICELVQSVASRDEGDVTWTSRRLISPVTWLFVKRGIQIVNKETTKDPLCWPIA